MSNTRTVVSPGVFAADALTVIPPTPVAGTAYRAGSSLAVNDTERGWPYATAVLSDIFNEIMFRCSTLIDIMDQQGMLGWTNLKNYTVGDHVLGSDKVMYRCIQVNGPGSTLQDPTTATAYWARAFSLASNAETITGTATDRATTPASIANLFTAAGRRLLGTAGFQMLPGGIILQWLSGTVPGPTSLNFTWPTPFPNSVDNIQMTVNTPGVGSSAFVTAYTTAGGSADFNSAADGGGVFIFAIGR